MKPLLLSLFHNNPLTLIRPNPSHRPDVGVVVYFAVVLSNRGLVIEVLADLDSACPIIQQDFDVAPLLFYELHLHDLANDGNLVDVAVWIINIRYCGDCYTV
jgi:hypothetical protein